MKSILYYINIRVSFINYFLNKIGITGQGQQPNSQQNCNPLGLGLNLSSLPMNPALVAAALNQAGWGIISGLQNQPEPPNFNQGFSSQSSGSGGGNQPPNGNQSVGNWMTTPGQRQDQGQWTRPPITQDKGFLTYDKH